MQFTFIIHGKYEGFLHKGERVCFTSNVKSAKQFDSQHEAVNYARRMKADKHFSDTVDILAIPSEGNEVK